MLYLCTVTYLPHFAFSCQRQTCNSTEDRGAQHRCRCACEFDWDKLVSSFDDIAHSVALRVYQLVIRMS